jgi:hypothetical protein
VAWQQRIADAFRNIVDRTVDFGAQVALGFHETYEELDAFKFLCVRYGWCVTPDFPFHVLLASALEAKGARNPKPILDRAIRRHLVSDDWRETRAIVAALRSSPALGAKRHKILADCMHILPMHGRDRFNAANPVVPTLLSLVDGIIADFAFRNLGVTNWHLKTRKSLVMKSLRSVCHAFDEPAFHLTFEVLYATAWGRDPPASGRRFNRHKIVHGNWLEFGRLEYVLRLVLIVSFVCYIVQEYEARSASGSTGPVTLRSQYAYAMSENPLALFREAALERLISRGIRPPQFSAVTRVDEATDTVEQGPVGIGLEGEDFGAGEELFKER